MICKNCGKEFTPTRKQICCSRSCAASYRNKERWKDDEYKKKYLKTVHSEKYRQNASKKSKELWNTVGHKEKVINSWRETYESSNYTRNLISENSKRMWADDMKKKEISDKIKESLNTPEMKEWRSKLMIEKWKNNDCAKKWFKCCFSYKDYVLPSGRIVKLQGYEPQVLEQLLQTYIEDDVVCGMKSINKELGKIFYRFQNKERRYFPDFYIKSTNTIIEVKSKWTFELHKEKNLAKQKACITKGFNFEFKFIEK